MEANNHPQTNAEHLASHSSAAVADRPADECGLTYEHLESNVRRNDSDINRKLRRNAIVAVWAVLSVLLAMEALARIVVAIGHPPQYGTKQFDAQKSLAEDIPNQTPAVLFLGSSTTTRDVYADLIDRTLKRKNFDISVYSLACHGAYPLDELYLLQTALEHGVAGLVVYEFNPGEFVFEEDYNREFSPMLQNSYEYSRVLDTKEQLLGKRESQPDLFEYAAREIDRCSYLLRYRSYLKTELSLIPTMLFNPSSMPTRAYADRSWDTISSHGFAPAFAFMDDPTLPVDRSRMAKYLKAHFPIREDAVHHVNYQSLSAVSAYCAKHRIPMALLWLPWSPGTHEVIREIMGLNESEFKTAVQRFAQVNRADLIDVHDVGDESLFTDFVHLNIKGSIEVSERIAAALSQRAAGNGSAPAGSTQ